MDLRHAGNAYSGCEPITKNKEKTKKKKERKKQVIQDIFINTN